MEQKIRDLVKTLGLLAGAIGFAFYGFDNGNPWIYFAGGLAVVLFLILLIVEVFLIVKK